MEFRIHRKRFFSAGLVKYAVIYHVRLTMVKPVVFYIRSYDQHYADALQNGAKLMSYTLFCLCIELTRMFN
jgi:hypothetical protein